LPAVPPFPAGPLLPEGRPLPGGPPLPAGVAPAGPLRLVVGPPPFVRPFPDGRSASPDGPAPVGLPLLLPDGFRAPSAAEEVSRPLGEER
jgi:hypothetical protein